MAKIQPTKAFAAVLAAIVAALVIALSACGSSGNSDSASYAACKTGMEHVVAESVVTNGSDATPDPSTITACKALPTDELNKIARQVMQEQINNLFSQGAQS